MFANLVRSVNAQWQKLQPRERAIITLGAPIVVVLLLFQLFIFPLQHAIKSMEQALPGIRANLIWLRQQSSRLETLDVASSVSFAGQDQSLVSILETTSRQKRLDDSIQQLSPDQSNGQVELRMENADFSRWIVWMDQLESEYGISLFLP